MRFLPSYLPWIKHGRCSVITKCTHPHLENQHVLRGHILPGSSDLLLSYCVNTVEMLKGFGVLGLIPCGSKGSAATANLPSWDLVAWMEGSNLALVTRNTTDETGR